MVRTYIWSDPWLPREWPRKPITPRKQGVERAMALEHFFWRFALNSHPLRKNLMQRKLKIDASCPVCSRHDEYGAIYF
jgi:hypothetical protein